MCAPCSWKQVGCCRDGEDDGRDASMRGYGVSQPFHGLWKVVWAANVFKQAATRDKVSLVIAVVLFVDLSQLEQDGVVMDVGHKTCQPQGHANPKLSICRITVSSNPNTIGVAIQNVKYDGGQECQDVNGRHGGCSQWIDDAAINVVDDPSCGQHDLKKSACGSSEQKRGTKHDGRNHFHEWPTPFTRQTPIDTQFACKSTYIIYPLNSCCKKM